MDERPDASVTGKLRGRFIVFDGPDGSGKSTQIRRFVDLLRRQKLPLRELREPGGTPIGEKIRQILLDPAHDEMHVRCEMLLYMASRAQVVAEVIRPALEAGEVVVADRFISSTLAYQGAAGGLPLDEILRTGELAVDGCWPDQTLIFDVDQDTAATRMASRAGITRYSQGQAATLFSDRMESKGAAYHAKVRQGYLDQARCDPDHYLVIDATADPDTVFNRLMLGLSEKAATLGW